MLTRLTLNNFVIVKQIEIEFSCGFCVLTGETGAGKSLLVGALMLLAGGRAGANIVRAPATQAQVEAVFDISDNDTIKQYIQRYDLDGDSDAVLFVRRVIGGRKNAIYINGHAATAAQLAELMSQLLDICGQHAHYSLRSGSAHRALLDSYAGADTETVAKCYHQWKAAEEASQTAARAAQQADETRAMLTEVLTELNALEFSSDKWRQMNAALTRTANISDLLGGCAEVTRLLQGEGAETGGASAVLAQVRRQLDALHKHEPSFQHQLALLNDVDALLADLLRDIRNYAERLEADPKLQQEAEEFIAECHRAARKYRVADPARLDEFIAAQQREYESLPTAESVEQLAAAAAAARKTLDTHCRTLSKQRQTAAAALCKEVNTLLRQLSMPKARLSVLLTPLETPAAAGSEKVALQIVTRDNMAPGNIADIASGGELSRLGLAIQIAAGKVRGCAVSVFDEVDAGISGAAAGVVGNLLKRLGDTRQVLCVTHLAQVAAKAHTHWRVCGGEALTVSQLDAQKRIEEIARMQSGEVITDSARRYAAELLQE